MREVEKRMSASSEVTQPLRQALCELRALLETHPGEVFTASVLERAECCAEAAHSLRARELDSVRHAELVLLDLKGARRATTELGREVSAYHYCDMPCSRVLHCAHVVGCSGGMRERGGSGALRLGGGQHARGGGLASDAEARCRTAPGNCTYARPLSSYVVRED